MLTTTDPTGELTARQWWERRRLVYNLALITAMVLGYFAYVSVVTHFEHIIGTPVVDEDGTVLFYEIELGGIAAMSQCCAGFLAILLANLFYLIGAAAEPFVPVGRIGLYRKWAWRAGVAFSCFLPFSISLLHLVPCLFFPEWYDRAPIVIPLQLEPQ